MRNNPLLKLVALAMTILFLTMTIPVGTVYADQWETYQEADSISVSVPEVLDIQAATNVNALTCASAMLIEADTGTILLAKDEYEERPIASVTKVMSMLLVMEAIARGDLTYETEVRVSAYAAGMGGSQAYIEEGEVFTVDEMLKAVAVHSSNDVTVALAEAVCGSELAFVEEMNAKVRELDLEHTVFADCTGLNDTDQHSCAHDVAMISRELINKYPDIFRYTSIWQDTFRNGTFELVNTNKLVRYYAGCDGLKTGFTNAAGFNLVSTAKRNDMRIISVVLGGSDSKTRFGESTALLDYGFATYSVADGRGGMEWPISIDVINGTKLQFAADPADGKLIISRNDAKQVEYKVVVDENLRAPISVGQEVGRVDVVLGDNVLGSFPLLSTEEVPRISYWWVLTRLWQGFLGNAEM
ncbi:MAG: D-alanyl-D-alanine carboxypeptidase [Clostridia bacterium]|nr:D-alanyl-D-alanine carboxypeptidase [Clostridia bacterium]